MKNLIRNSLRFGSAGLCLLFSLLPNRAGATLTTWDPQGTTGSNPYLNSMSGTWESALWSTSQTGQATPQNWVENTAALFAVHTGTGTPAFTVTMNANHTVAGVFDGPLTPNPCPVTIQGTGTMILPTGLDAFAVSSDSGNPGSLTINNVLAGPGTLNAQWNGQLYLNAVNTYTGGTQLGYTSNPFYGTISFNNSASFGTGGIIISNCPLGGALVAEGGSAITIANSFKVGQTNATYSQTLNLIGNPAGLTFSGPWNLGGFTPNIGSGGSGNLVILSGVISGSGSGFNKFNPGIQIGRASCRERV